jgi:hypothetical protein
MLLKLKGDRKSPLKRNARGLDGTIVRRYAFIPGAPQEVEDEDLLIVGEDILNGVLTLCEVGEDRNINEVDFDREELTAALAEARQDAHRKALQHAEAKQRDKDQKRLPPPTKKPAGKVKDDPKPKDGQPAS